MYLDTFKNGATSVIIRAKLFSSASLRAGLTGLSSSSAGLKISTIASTESAATTYTQAGSTIEAVTTNGTYAAPTATKCRFKEIDATNQPGEYEIQLADARFAVANARNLKISISGATNLEEQDLYIRLVPYNPDDTVRLGLTALPNAVAGANGGLPLGDASGRVDASKLAGQTITAAAGVTFPTSIASPTNITAGTITTVTNLTNAPTVGDLTAAMKASVNAEVVDGLNVDAYGEPPQGAPPASCSIQLKNAYMYKGWRNRMTQTGTAFKLYADNATTVDHKATCSDDGTTFDRGEVASGP